MKKIIERIENKPMTWGLSRSERQTDVLLHSLYFELTSDILKGLQTLSIKSILRSFWMCVKFQIVL
jgi:hypothetical protein